MQSEQYGKIDWHDRTHIALEGSQSAWERGVYQKVDRNEARKVMQEYGHNGLLSDTIPLNRSVPDTRPIACQVRKYYEDLPPVSVIIIFHNEYLSFLLRTIHSVIDRTPSKLLEEIVLVDDCSTKSYLRDDLEEAVARFRGKVKVVRLPVRSGLMRARKAGIAAASSDIVVVMDAHMEVNTNWLPPLLEPLVEIPDAITEPVVNWITSDTLWYESWTDGGVRGGFIWDMTYKYFPRQEPDSADIYPNPVLLGCIMAFNRSYFWHLGGFDEGLEIWGAEQYELSFKVWLSGGKLIRVPCSHVGHSFKNAGPHPFNNRRKWYYYYNHNRVAEVWMDEFKEVYYGESNLRSLGFGNVTEQLEIRDRLQCKRFSWFLENVFPEPLVGFCATELRIFFVWVVVVALFIKLA